MDFEVEQLHELTEQLEHAEDDFLALIERFPHLIKEPGTVAIMRAMRTAISGLRGGPT